MLRLLTFTLALLAFSSSTVLAARPNVIIILTDDQGYGDLSCHGNPRLKTPTLDQLYAESVRFTDFHVAPMCSPTRGELQTGLDAFRNGASAVCEGRSMPRRELPTMGQIFKDNGYATAHFGKWHMGDSYPYRPQDRGYDMSVHNCAWGIRSLAEYWDNDAFDDHYWRNNKLEQFPGYNTDAFFNEAMKWMKGQKQPFFVYLATTAAHGPFYVKEEYAAPYEDLGQRVANFYGMIVNIDENVARLEEFLKENDLRDDTILIFITDNGTVAGEKVYNAGMRGKKTSYYDGGHRVPFFLRWPAGGYDQPRDVDTLAHSTDVLPTLIDLCDLKNKRDATFDGQSLVPVLGGDASGFADRMFVIQYLADFKKWSGAVLWNKWRLVHGDELYDIATDPGQKNNVYDQHDDVVKAMRDYYEAWCTRSEPIMGRPNYVGIGTEQEPVTWLSSCNWTGSYCDNWGNLAAKDRFGHWFVEAESPGRYEVTMYVYHPAANAPLNQPLNNVPARPITQAKLIVDGKETVVDTKPDDTHATFHVSFDKGQRSTLEGQFLDRNGKPLCGAFYTFVAREGDESAAGEPAGQ